MPLDIVKWGSRQNCPPLSPLLHEKSSTGPYLKADAAHRQVAVVFQHAQILGYQGGRVHQAHGGLCVALLLGVFLRHVLEPGQPQVRGRLVTLGNSAGRLNGVKDSQLKTLFYCMWIVFTFFPCDFSFLFP